MSLSLHHLDGCDGDNDGGRTSAGAASAGDQQPVSRGFVFETASGRPAFPTEASVAFARRRREQQQRLQQQPQQQQKRAAAEDKENAAPLSSAKRFKAPLVVASAGAGAAAAGGGGDGPGTVQRQWVAGVESATPASSPVVVTASATGAEEEEEDEFQFEESFLDAPDFDVTPFLPSTTSPYFTD